MQLKSFVTSNAVEKFCDIQPSRYPHSITDKFPRISYQSARYNRERIWRQREEGGRGELFTTAELTITRKSKGKKGEDAKYLNFVSIF